MNQSLQRMDKDEWGVMRDQASMLVGSGFLPTSIKSVENAIAIILMGRELNIGPMASLQAINIIQNKPAVSPQLMLALIKRSGQLEDIKLETGADGATCTMKRKGNSPYTVTFGPKEAKALGLHGKDNYVKQAATMYQWRAVAAAARAVFPDVILGLYTPDEMGAEVDPDSGESMDYSIDDEMHKISAPVKELPEPAPNSVNEKREAYIKRINDLWTAENELGGQTPDDEPLPDDLYKMTMTELESLGKKVAQRVNRLADEKAA